jgi:hypothetical protein
MSAPEPEPDPDTISTFIELETRVWNALKDGDAEADARLLSDDFLGVYPSGFASRADHSGQLANGPTIADFEIDDARMITLSDENVLLSYRARFVRYGGNEREAMFVTSVWSRRDGVWLNVFSQDSATDG